MGVLAIFCWFLFILGIVIIKEDLKEPNLQTERFFVLILSSLSALIAVFATAATVAGF